MNKQYKYRDKYYSIINCTKEDIPSHIERVSSYWTSYGIDFNEQRKWLEKSVEQTNAYKMVDTSNRLYACAYLLPANTYTMQAVLGWFHTKIAYAIGCFFARQTLGLRTIAIMPHTNDFIPYQFAVDEGSIRAFYDLGSPLLIQLCSKKNIDIYKTKFRDNDIEMV